MHKTAFLSLLVVGWMCVAQAATIGTIDDLPGNTPPLGGIPVPVSAPIFDQIDDMPSLPADLPTLDEVKAIHRKAIADAAQNKQDTLYCASTSLDDEVYITSEDKSMLYCSVVGIDTIIMPMTASSYYLGLASCKWSKYLCVTSGDNVWTYFRHYDGSLIKYLACFKAYFGGSWHTYCWQYEIGDPGEDSGLGHIFRPDIASGYSSAKNLYNYYSEYYVKYNSTENLLELSATAQTVFRICTTSLSLVYC